MKREYLGEENCSSSWGNCSSDKAKMWGGVEEEDELFGLLGYTVKPSEMAEVAEKIHQIEMAMWNASEDGFSEFAADTIHYNPSDISSWLESMRSGVSALPEFDSSADSFLESPKTENGSCRVKISDRMAIDLDFGSDLIAIPGKAIYPVDHSLEISHQPPSKKVKTSPPPPPPRMSSSVGDSGGALAPRRSLLVDSEENGIRLVHTLMACAEAVQQEKLKLAEALVNSIGVLAVSQAGAMRKVALCFQEALGRRIRKAPTNLPDFSINYKLQNHFYDACPYLKFAHFTANQAIFEAFAGKKHVHVIDFSINQGIQWPLLLQALATSPRGAPQTFRLTGIGPPEQSDDLQQVGLNLSHLAKEMNVAFDYRKMVVKSLADLDASMLCIREGETVAVNSIFDLHQMLARPGAIDKVLHLVRELRPQIFTVVEQEASHNDDFFYDRFTGALHYYSALFDSLESGGSSISDEDKAMSELYLGQQICNVVACEGADRLERHETLIQWMNRFVSAGFEPVHLGSNVHKQAMMILAYSGGNGYTVDECNGCLKLGWQNLPLIATSAWRMPDSQ